MASPSPMRGSDQYESAEMTSPPLRVASPCQIGRLSVSLMNCTCPSPKRTFTPPGCRLRAAFHAGLCGLDGPQQSNFFELGAR